MLKCYYENFKRKYTYSTVLHLSKKNPRVSGPNQLKPVLFKGQLYITLVIQKKVIKPNGMLEIYLINYKNLQTIRKHTFKLDEEVRKNSTVEQKKYVSLNLCNMHIG